jgi:hypothetical protein
VLDPIVDGIGGQRQFLRKFRQNFPRGSEKVRTCFLHREFSAVSQKVELQEREAVSRDPLDRFPRDFAVELDASH